MYNPSKSQPKLFSACVLRVKRQNARKGEKGEKGEVSASLN
jgi:hypothetical protein